MSVPTHGRGVLDRGKMSRSKKGHNSEKKNFFFELSPFTAFIALWIVKVYSELQVDIFSNRTNIIELHSFCQVYSNTPDFLRKQRS